MAITKRAKRMFTGLFILLGSGGSSYVIANALGTDVIGFVAVSSIIGFLGGMIFMSGGGRL